MKKPFDGKKVLILGSCVDEISLVERAQQLGAYVIVSDYFTEPFRTPAKRIADEAWNDSWQDVDLIVQKCRANHVDGVMAGYSEIKIEYLIRICKELGLPCYCTPEQLEITRNKIKFKKTCRDNNVPVINEYSSISQVNKYPVIIKPVDRGGSIGISIANNYKELVEAYNYAMDLSLSKQVIIEDFISSGNKIDVYYSILDGEIELLSTDDTLNSDKNGFERVVQNGWVLPSKYHNRILEKVDKSLRAMIKNMGIRDGYIFFSGFADGDYIAFFECGFRLSGGHFYNYYQKKGMVNLLDIFIYHSILGTTRDLQGQKETNPSLKCAVVNYYAKQGEIKEIKGVHEIENLADCECALIDGYVGELCDERKAILSKVGMFYFCNNNPQALQEDINKANKLFSVIDSEGNDMIYDRINPSTIRNWWGN